MYDAAFWKGSHKLEGLVAVITGGDSGFARAVELPFAREGADVAIAYLAEDADAEVTKAAAEAEGRRASCCVATWSTAASAAKRCHRRCAGRIDVLVNNAAFQVHTETFLDFSPAHFDKTVKINLYGYFHLAQAAAAQMRPGSSIINTESVTGIDGIKGSRGLLDDRGGIHAFTRALSGNCCRGESA